jgi:hypothetical protein
LFDSQRGYEIYLFLEASRLALGFSLPLIQRLSKTLIPVVKPPKLETDHSIYCQMKDEWGRTPTSPYAFMVSKGKLYFAVTYLRYLPPSESLFLKNQIFVINIFLLSVEKNDGKTFNKE